MGCDFGPRCDHFQVAICDQGDIAMAATGGGEGHLSRCARIAHIDWLAEPERAAGDAVVAPGEVVLLIDNLSKYYDVAANALFGGGDTRTVKANEAITFGARAAEAVAIPPNAAPGYWSCWIWSNCRVPSPPVCRGNCRLAKSIALAWPAPSPVSPRWWSRTNRSRPPDVSE